MIILGIETSCDETAAAIIEGKNGDIKILSNVISSQIEIHKKYGGVIPEVAAREHVLNILPVINEALKKAKKNAPSLILPLARGGEKINQPQLSVFKPYSPFIRGRLRGGKKISAIAVTVGPGLITSLQVGVETAKTLAYAWNIPIISINHIEGHIYANFIGKLKTKIEFPALILTVSGGHNLLVLMKGHGQYKIIGETIDDAAGEAFDKGAAMLRLGYPGGPEISKYAEKYKLPLIKGSKIILPRPMIYSKDYNFSFSGLKTALLYKLQKDPQWKKRIPEYASEFESAITDVLIYKTIKAAKALNVKTIMLSGGVSANKKLRLSLASAVLREFKNIKFYVPDLKYTTDNAVMIAVAGYYNALNKKITPPSKLKTSPNLELKSN